MAQPGVFDSTLVGAGWFSPALTGAGLVDDDFTAAGATGGGSAPVPRAVNAGIHHRKSKQVARRVRHALLSTALRRGTVPAAPAPPRRAAIMMVHRDVRSIRQRALAPRLVRHVVIQATPFPAGVQLLVLVTDALHAAEQTLRRLAAVRLVNSAAHLSEATLRFVAQLKLVIVNAALHASEATANFVGRLKIAIANATLHASETTSRIATAIRRFVAQLLFRRTV